MRDLPSSPLLAITHLDGRNRRKVEVLERYFSEYAWIKTRLTVILRYVLFIAKDRQAAKTIIDSFSLKDAEHIIKLEKTTNHDLFAIILFVKQVLKEHNLEKYIHLVNLGIGSEDVNSIAFGIALQTSRGEVLLPAVYTIVKDLIGLSERYKDTSMLARTHGVPANITTLGKEFSNSLSRLCDEIEYFRSLRFVAKCSGEVGSWQAHAVLGRYDWIAQTDTFIRSFNLDPTHAATQIAPYDRIVQYLQSLYRLNSILLDFCKNCWFYVLIGYFSVKKVNREIGSAGMPQKVNPIYFEGAEGGLETANGIIETLVRKLPVNRLSRDFSDSTVRRNIVLPIAYSLLSYQSIHEALVRLVINEDHIARDLKNHAEAWTEVIKTFGLSCGLGDIEERLRKHIAGKQLNEESLPSFLADCGFTKQQKKELLTFIEKRQNPYPAKAVGVVIRRAKELLT